MDYSDGAVLEARRLLRAVAAFVEDARAYMRGQLAGGPVQEDVLWERWVLLRTTRGSAVDAGVGLAGAPGPPGEGQAHCLQGGLDSPRSRGSVRNLVDGMVGGKWGRWADERAVEGRSGDLGRGTGVDGRVRKPSLCPPPPRGRDHRPAVPAEVGAQQGAPGSELSGGAGGRTEATPDVETVFPVLLLGKWLDVVICVSLSPKKGEEGLRLASETVRKWEDRASGDTRGR